MYELDRQSLSIHGLRLFTTIINKYWDLQLATGLLEIK